jgi:membrane-associated phospholipid phosphatase
VLHTTCILLGASSAGNLAAQLPPDSVRLDATGISLFTRQDAWMVAGLVVATAVTLPNDRHLAMEFQRRDVQRNTTLHHAASVFRTIGQPGVLVASTSAWAIGRVAHRPVLAATGLRVTEAIAVAAALTTAGKVMTGRARPATTSDRDPHVFRWWKGTQSGYTSMPSGHTSASFAAASALADDWRLFAPRSARWAVPALYAGATLVGLSRMYHDRHWGSDVVAGAALGTLAGKVVGRWGRAHADNRVQRWLAPVALHADGGGDGSLRLSYARAW